ncbi:PhzF family phenazine biosynthesis protein [Pseudoalteromonas luteoviolacea]|uniref:Uncharacterized protein n=1 Tax=Pseudoalteromonas luteoviolacea DSM 6061 TaxID=1365250 RepID=A0A162A2Z8_9GAMM|nr:PhzF family phenazine biosynthesis protein [Pseudoalteromonas luteoviolacea]KZN43079.1 hypothetical protein N475_00440 [Pseudoalteromonas luteoviolacea DSM 6061]MBE0385588.1 hypothetical protein [Pseudoalteromonas luteoviolacea DSM 6061]
MDRCFVRQVFSLDPYLGNLASVYLCTRLTEYEDTKFLQAVAISNASPATAFVFVNDTGPHLIRWFSPHSEIQFCGHATLAAADVLKSLLSIHQNKQYFQAKNHKICITHKTAEQYVMHLPQAQLEPSSPSDAILETLNAKAISLKQTQPKDGYLIVQLQDKDKILNFDFDEAKFSQLTRRALLVTSVEAQEPKSVYFRYFAPQYGKKEDPATGSAGPLLAAFWRLPVNQIYNCYQLSSKGAYYQVSHNQSTVCIYGHVRQPR